jgi:hypothetical protein
LSAVKAVMPVGDASDVPVVGADGKPVISERKKLAQMAWNFVNDSLRTTLCLQYVLLLLACYHSTMHKLTLI